MLPGVNPDLLMNGINPLGPPSSSQATSVKDPQVPVYNAITPSVTTPILVVISMLPDVGTINLNHTSPPLKVPPQPGVGSAACVVALRFVYWL